MYSQTSVSITATGGGITHTYKRTHAHTGIGLLSKWTSNDVIYIQLLTHHTVSRVPFMHRVTP